jgi:hypothetical protein
MQHILVWNFARSLLSRCLILVHPFQLGYKVPTGRNYFYCFAHIFITYGGSNLENTQKFVMAHAQATSSQETGQIQDFRHPTTEDSQNRRRI